MTSFKAIRVHQVERATNSQLETITLDDLSAGEVVVRVAWSGLNYKDALAVSGKGRIMKGFPKVAGIDLSGIVESSDDPAWRKGDRVLVTGCNIGELLDGGLAERARVPASAVVRLPEGMDLREAMAIGTAGFTAALALKRMLENHQHPDMGPIVVNGPTGGVGGIALDLFSRAGFEVHALTGKAAAQSDYLKKLGAHAVIDRLTLDVGSRPLESATWGGAVDNLGGESLGYLTRTVRPWGNIASIGLAQAHTLETTVMPFILRGVSLLGIHSVECPRAWREWIWQQLAGPWKLRHLDTLVSREILLDQVKATCDEQVAGSLVGRTVVKLSGDL
ncbi:YhdH/YhfP family quinone oxidoreductase [Polycyclovorans algicola]|uniref:YhdH/YhfP family quinone oxidoreductase n=1 Tax=Polycyclovorans algicola TaxID=616992 RepID=UPI0004A77F34|nr:YhdH/YhfP family quinone oxidoreductase [Polycyclovorans algicola]